VRSTQSKLLHRIEKQTASHHNILIAVVGGADGTLSLPQRKGARQRNKPPVNKHSEKPTPKQDSWWTTELIS
jgi:hypothetical protein